MVPVAITVGIIVYLLASSASTTHAGTPGPTVVSPPPPTPVRPSPGPHLPPPPVPTPPKVTRPPTVGPPSKVPPKVVKDLSKLGKAKVSELVRSPDADASKIPMSEGKPAYHQRREHTGQRVPITDVHKTNMVVPNTTPWLLIIKGLQSQVGVEADGRLGDDTLNAFIARVTKLGFKRHPLTVAQLARNAVKWTEVLRMGISPDKVGATPRMPGTWALFAKAMATADSDEIGHGGRLGHFCMSPIRLEQMGVMCDVKPMQLGDERVMMGACVGFELDDLLADSKLQLKIFRDSSRDYAKRIMSDPELRGLLGRDTQWGPITLSGLLGVANQAGIQGMVSWVTGDKRFEPTTEVFRRTNGIF